MNNYRFIISGGGTGGHIYPAIAIAKELEARFPDASFLFVGAKDKMEMEKVPQAGYKIEGLWISGLQRKLTLKNLMFPFKLIHSLIKSRGIIRRFKPDMVIGTGGYASGPLLTVAASKGIPSVIQEQNSFPGITNKVLAKKVQKIFVAYDGLERYFPKGKIIKTGNPVRQDLLNLAAYKDKYLGFFDHNEDRKTLFVMGGSLGARRINQLVEKQLNFFRQHNVQIIWQCGKLYYPEYKKYQSEFVKVYDFINNMELAYTAADFIISRSGASSVSELALVGKPVIFIPSPNVAEDHQTKNAMAVVNKQAALIVPENKLDAEFEELFLMVLNSEKMQYSLAENFKELALPNATKDIVDHLEQLLKTKAVAP
ncbi:undecaprenyldiphospho-muramoylpentapeptide beta-N-acetylglucosaminyltransferase [Galbibacter sp.]|uniref:undecaprenyldiphospho-muramoylpentapeptide beta-N-acetylglucosaminyltransferase n=1 Tax=Galbibacter sp. TaxID=2918471 RepID=UPI003A8D596E